MRVLFMLVLVASLFCLQTNFCAAMYLKKTTGLEDNNGNTNPDDNTEDKTTEKKNGNGDLPEKEPISLLKNGLRSLTNISSLSQIVKERLDPDSDFLNYLISEVIEDGDKEHRVLDDFRDIVMKKSKVYGDRHDRHRLTEKQKRIFGTEGTRFKRNLARGATLWPDGIVRYSVDTALYGSAKDNITKAMAEIADKTCIEFIEDYEEKEDKITFKAENNACWSYIGNVYQYDVDQIINLGSGCTKIAIIIHEILHALGFVHEQSRSDRDKHIGMDWNNIVDGTENINMIKYITDIDVPYNYESSLQYDLYAFAKNPWYKTMYLPSSYLDFLANANQHLSFYDAKEVIQAYGCTEHCTAPPECKNGGYVDHKCNCACPSNIQGDTCEVVHNSDLTDCSKTVDVTDGLVHTLSDKNEIGYIQGRTCTWLIVGSEGKQIHLTLKRFNLPIDKYICRHTLEMRYHLPAETGPRFCGKISKPHTFVSLEGKLSNYMMLKLDTTMGGNIIGELEFDVKQEG